MKFRLLYLLMVFMVILACNQDKVYLDTPLDQLLDAALTRAAKSGDKNDFILPDETDYSNIPQDAHNPLTKEKVHLGKWLFFETGLGLVPNKEAGKQTYSCASCHIPSAGYRPGGVQGIADGGIGFGHNGEGRTKLSAYRDYEMDVQGLRPLSVLNVAFVENSTWNGRFGSEHANQGTEDRWLVEEGTDRNEEGLAAGERRTIQTGRSPAPSGRAIRTGAFQVLNSARSTANLME